jgi:hypothetical protein
VDAGFPAENAITHEETERFPIQLIGKRSEKSFPCEAGTTALLSSSATADDPITDGLAIVMVRGTTMEAAQTATS